MSSLGNQGESREIAPGAMSSSGNQGRSREIAPGARATAECAAGRWRSMRRRTRSLRRGHCSRMPRDPRGRYGSAARALRLPRPLRAACRPRARRSPSSAVARAAGSPPPLLPPPRQPPRSPAGRARTAPWARTGAPDEADNQTQSDSIRRQQTPSDAIRLAQAHRSVIVGRRPGRHRAG